MYDPVNNERLCKYTGSMANFLLPLVVKFTLATEGTSVVVN